MTRFILLSLLFSSFNAFSAVIAWTDFTLDKGHVFLPVSIEDFVVTLDYRYGKLHIALPQK
ncbi:hypothetical protein AMBAS45_06960 [Alteromonas macleodii str. 'Balearic Sea AD45']|uniref:hypothetical protein n=1 Tax=Alteromonas macleodii TaxID=28108 RepID=UPI000286D072|nr:hypothetical protein [Alteromonas macleodii]AFT94868.1 hypothetical protein AMBAS45_06960 [Alteromonas macleodii str. 'Balearic Sea AD45']